MMELGKHFEGLQDFRVEGRCKHVLSDILLLVLCGILADCSDFAEIADYGKDKEGFLREELGLQLPNGIPSEDTLWRVLRYLKSSEVEKSLQSCCREIMANLSGRHLCIDGKELRGTIPSGKKHALIQQVSVWLGEESLSFAQLSVAEKSNEIMAIPALLDIIDCQGSTITIDAIACQKEIVAKIVEKEANYLIGLKKNQSALYEQVSEWLVKRKGSLPCFEQLDKGHGRLERRRVYVCEELNFLDATHEWENLNSIVLVESTRLEKDKQQTNLRFYISSLSDEVPEAYAKLVRGHWSIENNLHWQLDVTFREDNSQVKKDNGPQNLSIIRKIALLLLAQENSKISMKRKRKKAARNNHFLKQVLKYT